MAKIKASELARMLNQHVEKHGDDIVFILDEKEVTYKSLSHDDVMVGPERRFVINCWDEINEAT